MHYSLKKQLGVLAVLVVAGMGYQSHGAAIKEDGQAFLPDHASHGLRVYLDPDTGQFTPPPPEQPPPATQQPALTAQAGMPPPLVDHPPVEVRSSKAGGGFSVDLQARFRPSRHGPVRIKAGS